jgi:hypothetical protein
MPTRLAIAFLLLLSSLQAAVPTPQEHFGYSPGDEYKLADYADVSSYFQKLAKSTDRIKLLEIGRSALGKPMFAAFISTPQNLAKLERYREISRRLTLGLATAEEARAMAAEGRVIVWIDSGLHASEVAPVQQAPHLAYKLLTDESAESRRIRENVIVMQIPVINPDGLDLIAHWYRKNVGTPYELAGLPGLYQKYSGHDNNRDWFMLNLQETRHISRLLFQEWFPQIVYNQHQSPTFPARIFVPPYAEPLNPNIPAAVMEGINVIGSAMAERFARENKPGVISYWGYDGWWNGGLRSVPAFHNMHGILTETALYSYATPHEYKLSDLPERFPNGIPTKESSIFYQRPWMGGKWGVRDAVEYMLTADWAILDLASARREYFLEKAYAMARANIDAGKRGSPYAYVIAPEQWDPSAAVEMVKRLMGSGVDVQRAKAPFQAGKKSYPAGTLVLPAGQPFRGYLMDLMEPQVYPELRSGTTGPTKRPYDIAGWTLSMQMNVHIDRITDTFQGEMEAVTSAPEVKPTMDHRDNASFISTAEMLDRGAKVGWAKDGKIVTSTAEMAWELRKPRLALYEPYIANMDQGWTQWVLDTYKVPYTLVHNEDFRNGDLRQKYDTILFTQQTAESILHGNKRGELEAAGSSTARRAPATPRPEHTGGIEVEGMANLERFVKGGGTMIAFSTATDLPLQFFPLRVRNILRRAAGAESEGGGEAAASSTFYSPGSLLRITVDTENPLAFGMPKEAIAFSSGGQAFEANSRTDPTVKMVAKYATSKLLASGWISGERAVLGKGVVVEAAHGTGRIVLFGIRPQHRGQPFGTFKFLLNAIYLGSAKQL